MYTRQPKSMLTLQILDILRKHSDAEHRLSQQDIRELLEKEHQVRADRGTIRRNLFNLVDYGYDLEWTEVVRKNRQGEEFNICTDWFLVRMFDNSQLRLLIDSIFFSRNIPRGASTEMIGKLLSLGSRHFKAGVSSMRSLQEHALTNPQLFYTIDVLDEAIQKRVQVTFEYNSVGLDKKLMPRRSKNGSIIQYRVNPYGMVVANGRHYLIGNNHRYSNCAHFRIDRITDIHLTENGVKPMNEVSGLEHGLNLPRHMMEHLYMFSDESVQAVFSIPASMMDTVIDWFGTGVTVQETGQGQMQVHVRVNRSALRYWALQYARYVTVLSPEDLAKDIREDLEAALARYQE